jgi:hypothetical protein
VLHFLSPLHSLRTRWRRHALVLLYAVHLHRSNPIDARLYKHLELCLGRIQRAHVVQNTCLKNSDRVGPPVTVAIQRGS